MPSIRGAIDRIARQFGYQRGSGSPIWRSPAELAAMLRGYGLQGRHIIDVGAHKGWYSRALLGVFPEAYCSMFEPQTDLHPHMADLGASSRVALISKGVGASSGIHEFTRHERSDSQSFAIAPGEAADHGWARERIEVVSIDDYMTKCPWPTPDIIKIDAEGWDLEVLRGAANALRSAEVVFMEASIVRPQPPHLPTVLKELDAAGYLFLGVTDLLLNQGFPWFAEVAVIRKGGVVDSRIPRELKLDW